MSDDEIREVLNQLANTPTELSRLVSQVSPERIAVKSSAEEFSVLENVCHLRDLEVEGYAIRIQRMLQEDQPSLPDFEGARLAIEREYNRQDLNQALTVFSEERGRNLLILSAAGRDEFERTGELDGLGKITLLRLVEMMNEHDEGHLDDLRRCGRLAAIAQPSPT
jgi:hypothetical protein